MINKKEFNERFLELSFLKDGWLDGNGFAISNKSIDTAKKFIQNIEDAHFIYPLAFPEYNGGIILEWFNQYIAISLEIDNGGNLLILSAYDFAHKKDFNCTTTVDETNEINRMLRECLQFFKNIH